MVTCSHADQETTVEQVQVTDLENAAHLPTGRCIKGMLAGNDNWRSPEAHFKGELNKPTDMFSFGIMVRSAPSILQNLLLTCAYSVYMLCSAKLSSVLMTITKTRCTGRLALSHPLATPSFVFW
jgi:hypothetical protein